MVGVLTSAADPDNARLLAPAAAVCGTVIAGFVAWVDARKSPADRLQQFVTIYTQWPTGLTGCEHVAQLIHGQVGEMWHRYPHLNLADPPVALQRPHGRPSGGGSTDDEPAGSVTAYVISNDQIDNNDKLIKDMSKRRMWADVWACAAGTVTVAVSVSITWPIDEPKDVWAAVASLLAGFALVVAISRALRIIRYVSRSRIDRRLRSTPN